MGMLLPVLDADGADDGWAEADADYAAVLGAEAARVARDAVAAELLAELLAEEVQAAVGAELQVQAQAHGIAQDEHGLPLYRRDCSICLAPMDDPRLGPMLALPCHSPQYREPHARLARCLHWAS